MVLRAARWRNLRRLNPDRWPEHEQMAFALELKHEGWCASWHEEECDCDPRAAMELLDRDAPEEPVQLKPDLEHPPREIFYPDEDHPAKHLRYGWRPPIEYKGTDLQREHERRYEHDPARKAAREKEERERAEAERLAAEKWAKVKAENERLAAKRHAEWLKEEAAAAKKWEAWQAERRRENELARAAAAQAERMRAEQARQRREWISHGQVATQMALAEIRGRGLVPFIERDLNEGRRIWARHYYGPVAQEPDVTQEGWEEEWARRRWGL